MRRKMPGELSIAGRALECSRGFQSILRGLMLCWPATQHPTYLHAAPRAYRLRLVYGADIHRLRAAGLLRELATPLFYAGAAARKR